MILLEKKQLDSEYIWRKSWFDWMLESQKLASKPQKHIECSIKINLIKIIPNEKEKLYMEQLAETAGRIMTPFIEMENTGERDLELSF